MIDGEWQTNTMINQVDAVVPSLNTLYSQRFKGSIGYQAATEVKDQGLSGSNSYIMNLWNPNNQTHYKLSITLCIIKGIPRAQYIMLLTN